MKSASLKNTLSRCCIIFHHTAPVFANHLVAIIHRQHGSATQQERSNLRKDDTGRYNYGG